MPFPRGISPTQRRVRRPRYTLALRVGVSSFAVGYICDVEHLGQGYVTEAVRGALRMIFGPLQGTRAAIYCDDTNLRSARVAERCGFVREGHLRANHCSGNHPVSGDYIYGLLRDEYLARGGEPLPGHAADRAGVRLRPCLQRGCIAGWRSTVAS